MYELNQFEGDISHGSGHGPLIIIIVSFCLVNGIFLIVRYYYIPVFSLYKSGIIFNYHLEL